jgi:hypothetical protein
MPDEKKADDVEKLLSEEKLLEDRKQALIDDLLKQREAAMDAFDEKLGYHANSGKHTVTSITSIRWLLKTHR